MTTAIAPSPTTSPSIPATENATVGNDPSMPSAAYNRMKPRWTKCRDCLIGTEAIRAGGTDYLPQYGAESDARYEIRKVLAAFYNGFARTVLASVGILLEEEPALGEDMPGELVQLWENIDAAGTHGTVFARRLLTSGIVDSHAGIMVEFSKPDAPTVDRSKASAAATPGAQLSGDDEKRLGLRPYWLLFRADDVIRALYQPVKGIRTLVLLILREVVTERVGLFGTKTVVQYRIYTNNGGTIEYQLWKSPNTSGTNPTKAEGPLPITNQTEIPWSPFIAGEEVAPGEYKPPLLDLADLNIQYHGTLTNMLSLQSLAFVPTPVRIGAQLLPDGTFPELVLGPGNTIEAPVTEGVPNPVYWLSPPVDVLEPGERTLQSTKADMATMGAAFLSAETRAAETAEGKRIDSAAQRATLATVSRALKDCIERAFGFMASYLKLEGGSLTLNDNFTGEGVDTAYLAILLQSFMEDAITLEQFRFALQNGQLPEDFDPADILELVAIQAAREKQRIQEAQDRAKQFGNGAPGAGSAGA